MCCGMSNEDRIRSIIESDQYQNIAKRKNAMAHSMEMQSNYYEGMKDGIKLAIRAFRNCDFTGYCNCPYCSKVGDPDD